MKNYLVFIEHEFGIECKTSEDYKAYLDHIISEIHKLIVENKSTYVDGEEPDQQLIKFERVSTISPYVDQLYCADYGTSLLIAYLTPEIIIMKYDSFCIFDLKI